MPQRQYNHRPDLRGHEETVCSFGIRYNVRFGAHPALCSTDQAAPLIARPPFFNRRLVAVRCAFRQVASIMIAL